MQVWKDRSTSYFKLLNHLLTQVTAHNKKSFFAGLEQIIKAFRPFAKAHFNYFYSNFDPQKNRLSTRGKYSAEYAMRVVVARIRQDIMIYERIFNQRLNYPDNYKKALQIGDEFATHILKAAHEAKLLSDMPYAITYFDKLPNIRLIPYANVALVAIPLSVIDKPSDYLAIAHELGHYIYHNGSLSNNKLKDKIEAIGKGRQTWLQAWTEEIFADIFGALVGGAMMAHNWQEIEMETSDMEFLYDDADHPVPLIRPDIYHYILDKHLGRSSEANALRKHWKEKIDERWRKKIKKDSPSKETITLASSKSKAVSNVRNMLENYVEAIAQEIDWKPESTKIEMLMEQPEYNEQNPYGKLSTGNDLKFEELPQSEIKSVTYKEWIEKHNYYEPKSAQNISNLTFDTWNTSSYQQNGDGEVNEEDWLKVLHADGWTSEGPHNRNDPD